MPNARAGLTDLHVGVSTKANTQQAIHVLIQQNISLVIPRQHAGLLSMITDRVTKNR